VKEAKDKISRACSWLDDFSVPRLPLLPQPPSPHFLRRKVLDIRPAGAMAVFGIVLAFSPILSAQTSKQPETPKPSEVSGPLSHDLSGVWMQYPDGPAPGVPGMNAVDERFRPPFTP